MNSKLLFVALLFSTTISFANGNDGNDGPASENLKVKLVSEESKFNLEYRAKDKGTVRVNIYDSNNHKIYSDFLRSNTSFVRPYNFEGLPEGAYTIEVIDADGTLKKEILYKKNIIKNELLLDVEALEKTKKYIVSVKGAQADPIFINIYNDSREVIFTDKVEVTSNFKKGYDLSNIYSTKFTFEVVSDGEVISQTIE